MRGIKEINRDIETTGKKLMLDTNDITEIQRLKKEYRKLLAEKTKALMAEREAINGR